MLTKLTGCRTSTSKTCDIHDGDIFGHQINNLNKVGRCSQDDATNIIVASDKKIFLCFCPWGITWLNSSDNGE